MLDPLRKLHRKNKLAVRFLLFICLCMPALRLNAQPKPATDHPETRFQRWLPIPPSRASQNSPFAEALQQSPNPQTQSPNVSESDVKQLQELIKQFGDQLPSDFKAPNLDGLSAETLSKAMADPEVREKAERLIEQYTRNNEDQSKSSASTPSSSRKAPPPSTQSPKPKNQPRSQTQTEKNGKSSDNPTEDSTPDPEQAEEDPFQSLAQPKNENTNQKTNRLQQQREMAQSIEEFLKQVDESELKAREKSNETSPNSQTSQNTSEAIKKQLDEKGFGPTLQRIIEEANQASRKESNAITASGPQPRDGNSDPSKSGEAKAPSQLPKPKVSPPAEQPKLASPPNASANPSKPSSTTTTNSNNNNYSANSWSNWFAKIAKEINATPAAKPPQLPNPETGVTPNQSLEIALPSPWLLLPTALVGLALTILILYSRRRRVQTKAYRDPFKNQIDLLKTPSSIQTRADVILAFHQLADRIVHPLESWWTHRNIARQVCRTMPSAQSPVNVVVDIYEQARYLPSEVRLTDNQIDEVRRALKECETSKN
jgi:hypothetical protein